MAIATGSSWRSDGIGHQWTVPIPLSKEVETLTPDHLIDGRRPSGRRVLIWDDDHYYMGGVLAELLAAEGFDVTLATPASEVSTWTRNTMEQHLIQRRLLELGVAILPNLTLSATDAGLAELACTYTGTGRKLEMDCVVPVTSRLANDDLYRELRHREREWRDAGIEAVSVIGDAEAPATIAHAVFAGRRFAEEIDRGSADPDIVPFRRELAALAD